MLSIYKKCEKSLSNPSGIVEITNINELSKPFLLCISTQDIIDKSIYGIMREGAQAARVCTSQEDAPFKLSSIPLVDSKSKTVTSSPIYFIEYICTEEIV